METRDSLFIGTEWVKPTGSEVIVIRSPFTEEAWAEVPSPTSEDVDRAVAVARTSYESGTWSARPVQERASIIDRVADLVEARLDDFAHTITSEMGAPITIAQRGHVGTSVKLLRFFAELARDYPFTEERTDGSRVAHVVREPVGVAVAIAPWNWPLLTSIAKIAPALLAGCPVILKPSPETALDPYLLAEAFVEAGLPKGVLSILGATPEVSEHLVRHPGIDKVAFTGSTTVGRRIAAHCGEHLKRVTMELGGKAAAIVLDDAPLEKTISRLVPMATNNSGQSCMSQTRVLVSGDRHDEFVDAFAAAIAALPVGDPFDASTVVGPMVTEKHRERVEGYIELGRSEGARVVTGGGRPAGEDRGWFVEPTVFVDVASSMRLAREEIFGPVVSVMRYGDEEDAIRIANDTPYGLGGSVWTDDVEHGVEIARRVRTGSFRVNGAIQMFETPMGGMKDSGIGREYGPEGLHAFLEDKTIASTSLSKR